MEFVHEEDFVSAFYAAHRTFIDGAQILVDFMRAQTVPGWVPRRLGGGVGGKKQSGQMRFGGRDCPFHAPYDSNRFLKKGNKDGTDHSQDNRSGQRSTEEPRKSDYTQGEQASRRTEKREHSREKREHHSDRRHSRHSYSNSHHRSRSRTNERREHHYRDRSHSRRHHFTVC